MGRVGEGFSLARVNQASLIDEPALRAGRGMRVHGPWPPQAMGNGRPRWEEPESWDCTGTWIHSRKRTVPPWLGHVLRARLQLYTTGSGFPAGTKSKVPGTAGTPHTTNEVAYMADARTDDKL